MGYRFTAIDLETTGLNPEKDTIIEVAAIVFSLEKLGRNLTVKIEDKRTMLIDPGIPLSEEVTIITGITDEMLVGKPLWRDVSERVQTFIAQGEILVGHNVLFDISMLRSHGIDLGEMPVIDTFELSEFLSQGMESLNLGFLTKTYGLKTTEGEHRALGDTHLSVYLFERYINECRNITEEKRSIFRLMEAKEEQDMVKILNTIIELPEGELFSMEQILKYSVKHDQVLPSTPHESRHQSPTECFSLDGNRETEVDLLLSYIEKYERTKILVANQKVQGHLIQTLREHGKTAEEVIGVERFCSIQAIKELLQKESWERKESILIGKLLWWLQDTKTGLLEELKFYGTEQEFLPYLRSSMDESSYFYELYIEKIAGSGCVIDEFSNFIKHPEDANKQNLLIIKDIPLFEEYFRRNFSTVIHTDTLIREIRGFPNIKNFLLALFLVIDIYENTIVRPKGQEIFPPGNFGETYFIKQAELWGKKGKWLVLFHELLWGHYIAWKDQRVIETRKQQIEAEHIDKAITMLTQFGLQKNENCNLILQIKERETVLHFIPRNITKHIRERMIHEQKNHIVHYGYKLTGPIIQHFLQHECAIFDIPKNFSKGSERKRILVTPEKDIPPGSIVLCTSQKQIREYGKLLGRKYTNTPILMQGLSGGKGKILSLFLSKPKDSIIIGLIDTWRDEFAIFHAANEVHILKLPFDPPSDPYFLARTVGISDNFSEYSQPMMVIKINTLIGRIQSAGYRGKIFCHDERIQKTNWGTEIEKELL